MNEIFSNPIIWQSTIALVIFLVVCFKIYSWFEKGGAYNMKYPVAAKMDAMARPGDLVGADVEAAILSVDPSDSKQGQVQTFEANIKSQKA